MTPLGELGGRRDKLIAVSFNRSAFPSGLDGTFNLGENVL